MNRGPEFLCVNQPTHVYAGGIEFDGDSVVYSLTDCLSDYNTPINYVSPYLGSSPLSTVNGITVNSTTGELDFTPNIAQVGIVCVKAEEYRNGLKINEAVREMNFPDYNGLR